MIIMKSRIRTKLQTVIQGYVGRRSGAGQCFGTEFGGPHMPSNSGQETVLLLMKPASGTKINITGDNWFTTVSVVQNLLQRGTTYVLVHFIGTNERYRTNLYGTSRGVMMSEFGFQEDCALHSYCPKGRKTPLMVPPMSHNGALYEETGDHRKSEIMNFSICEESWNTSARSYFEKNDVASRAVAR
jgi:hypothetical protein